MTNKNYHKKRFSYSNIVISVMLKPLKQHLIEVTSFRLSKLLYSWSVPCNTTNNSVSVFPDDLDHRIYETKFLTHASFLFSVFYFLYHFKFFFDPQNFIFHHYSHVITLPVSCLLQEQRSSEQLYAQSELPLGSSLFWHVMQC